VGHLSRIENGKRPPTENLAAACDAAFPERRGWFSEYYEEMRTWSEVPAAFKDWSELEDKAATLSAWARLSSTGCCRPRTTPPRCCTPIPVLVRRRCRLGWPRGWSGKSSYSGANGGDCAEVAVDTGLVLVRDTKNRVGATLAFNAQAWRTFTAQVKHH
jgi:hypothetical protein